MINVRSSGVEEGLIGAVAQFACTRGGGREVAEALGLPDECSVTVNRLFFNRV